MHVDDIDGGQERGVLKEAGEEVGIPCDAAEDDEGVGIGLSDGVGSGFDESGELGDGAGPVGGIVGFVPEFPGVDAGAVAGDEGGEEACEIGGVARWGVPEVIGGITGGPAWGIADVGDEADVVFIDGDADEVVPEGEVELSGAGLHVEPAEGDAEDLSAGGAAGVEVGAGVGERAGGFGVILAKAHGHGVEGRGEGGVVAAGAVMGREASCANVKSGEQEKEEGPAARVGEEGPKKGEHEAVNRRGRGGGCRNSWNFEG